MTRTRLIVHILLVAAAALFLNGCSKEGRIAKRLAEAEAYYKAGDYDKAEVEYKNVLQTSGPNPTALARLGSIYFDQTRLTRTTFALLFRAAEAQPDNLEVKIRLGYFYLAVSQKDKAQETALAILEKKPDHPVAPFLLAESCRTSADIAMARGRIQSLPKSGPTVAALGILLLQDRQSQAGYAQLEEAYKQSPKALEVVTTLAQAMWAQKNTDRAEKLFTEAIALAPIRTPVRLVYTKFLIQAGKTVQAKDLLETTLAKAPDFLGAYAALAGLALMEKQPQVAAQHLKKAIERESSQPDILMMMASAQLELKDFDGAILTLQKAAQQVPENPEILYRLGNAHLQNNDLSEAVSRLSEAVKLAPGHQPATVALAKANAGQQMYGPAVALLKALLQKFPGNREAATLLAECLLLQGNLDDALLLFRKFVEVDPGNIELQFQLGSILTRQNKRGEAEKILNKVLEVNPTHLGALETLVELDLADQKKEIAIARINRFIAQTPAAAEPLIILARVYLRTNSLSDAEIALQKAVSLKPDYPEALQLLGRLYYTNKQYPRAIEAYKSAIAKSPKNVELPLQLAIVAEETKDFPTARKYYEQALALNPKLPLALNNLADLLAKHFKETEKALALAKQARELMPAQGEPADTLGWITFQQGQFARSLSLLEEAANKLPTNPEVQYHYGAALYMTGREAAAKEALEKALSLKATGTALDEATAMLKVLTLDLSNPKAASEVIAAALAKLPGDTVALQRAAALQERKGAADKALEGYEAILKTHPGYPEAALGAIRLYRSKNERGKALELAKATRKLMPGDGRIAHVTGRLAYESGERLSAVSILQDAAQKRDGDAEVLFDLSEAALSVGQLNTAETAFQSGLKIDRISPRAKWASQTQLWMSLAKDPAEVQKAVGQLEAALKESPQDLAALYARAVASVHQGDLKVAQQTYDRILGIYPDFVPAKRGLAIVLVTTGENDRLAFDTGSKAREVLTTDADLAKAIGIAAYRLENNSRALSLLQEASRSKASDAEVFFYLGMTQKRLKDSPGATRSLQKALTLGLTGTLAEQARAASTAK
ncbi:tetratricopeptide repeat protein [Horticoccus sp. 23ND18S-11]|uniref:tetratricopeptide repeat protein n=1 Tax=Horticoccus sp. 23ND18S-11 TaxID=3391832 RepID=UPI0039C9B80D